MDRRRFLAAGTAFMGTTLSASARSATGSPLENPALQRVCDEAYAGFLNLSPILCTSFGVDRGPYARQKSRLEGDTPADRANYRALLQSSLDALGKINRTALVRMDRINYDTLKWQWSTALAGVRDFPYGVKAPSQAQSPYVLSHMSGMAQALPDFFDSNHQISTRDDVEAYLARLARYAAVLDSETEHFHADIAAGARPPAFIIKRAIAGLKGWRAQSGSDNILIASLDRRIKEKGLDSAGGVDWTAQAQGFVDGPIHKALDVQIAALEGELPKASDDAGVWHLPRGSEYYAHMVRAGTSTQLTAEEIHAIGLQKVIELTALVDRLLREQGLTQGTPGERLAALFTDTRFIAPNTDAGRAQVMGQARALVDSVTARLPGYFSTLPRAKLIIRRPPPVNEGSGPPYYLAGTVDGTRPGSYYLPLADTSGAPSWTIPSTTFHEAIPGHHLQNSLLIENAAIPLVRNLNLAKPISDFNAYDEGWALYAEQLADEMGMYADDPFGRIGYVDDALFRAGRLVVDTGIHHLRWSRAQAVDYMTSLTGKRSEAETEIDRYCVWPGQALGYMVGKIQWLRLRDAMKTRQGQHFDIRQFHAVGLGAGSTALDVLDQVYRAEGLI
jgi:uncharacterized protein (DUF885 family)